MPARFVNIDHDSPMLLPPDLRDWIAADHMVHFAIGGTKILANASKHNAVSYGHAINKSNSPRSKSPNSSKKLKSPTAPRSKTASPSPKAAS